MGLLYILLYVVVALATAVFYFLRKNVGYWQVRGIPHDTPHFFYGNFRGFRQNKVLQDIHKTIYQKYKGTGPFCGVHFFYKPFAFVLDTALAKNILIKDFNSFRNRGSFYNERDDPLSGHLFALDGDKWKQLRHKLSPTFTSGKMKFMFPTVVKVGEQFVEVLKNLIERDNTVEIKELLARFTTDVIGTCAFGIDCNSLKDPNAEFRVMGKKTLTTTRHSRFVTAFIRGFPKQARRLRMCITPEDIHQFFMRIVRETVTLREQQHIKRNDFMDLLIELKNNKEVKLADGEVLRGLTMEEVAAQAFVFFLAGFETSSTAMGFAVYELALNQNVQDKARQEINEILAKHKQEFSYECVKDMKYLDQVLSETLRFYPILPHLVREAVTDYVVPGHPKYVIEKNLSIIIPYSAYQHDPEFYPDPEKFDPERFSAENVAKRDPMEWLPFGDGPRNCIGMRFGQMQSRIGLALLLKNFKFTPCQQTQIPIKLSAKSFLLAVADGIFLRVEKI